MTASYSWNATVMLKLLSNRRMLVQKGMRLSCECSGLSSKQVGSTFPVQPPDEISCHLLLHQLGRTMRHHRYQQQRKAEGIREITPQDSYGFFKSRDFSHEKKYLGSLS